MPTAWEEAWGAGLTTGVRLALGSGASMNIMYTTPTVLGTTMTFTYAPEYGAADQSDKTGKSASNAKLHSYDGTININPSFGTEILSGLNVFVAASTIETSGSNGVADIYEGVGGVTYDIGPLSLGYQVSGDYTGVDDTPASDAGAYNFYKNHAFGIAFNVNDDLSISYGEWEARKSGKTNTSLSEGDENTKTIRANSVQMAYTMGGASVRLADTSVENQSWSSGTNLEATTISIGLAF